MLASSGSAALLLGAWTFQHIGELPPCKMCIWQRYPHGVAVISGVLAFVFPGIRPLPLLGALAATTTAGIGFFHAGVEKGWWEGPATCTSGPIGGLTADELLDQIMSAPLARCDEIPWEMFGISMAGWNGMLSSVLVVIWIAAWRVRQAYC